MSLRFHDLLIVFIVSIIEMVIGCLAQTLYCEAAMIENRNPIPPKCGCGYACPCGKDCKCPR